MSYTRDANVERLKEPAYTHLKFLYNMALRYAGNRFDAEDLVQETFCSALKTFHQLRDEGKCKSWLLKNLRDVYLKEYHRTVGDKKRRQGDQGADYVNLLEEAAERFDSEKNLSDRMDSLRIRSHVDQLPEKYKSPVLLHYMGEMSYKEISQALDIPMGTVMSRLARGKVLLKKEILNRRGIDHETDRVLDFKRSSERG